MGRPAGGGLALGLWLAPNLLGCPSSYPCCQVRGGTGVGQEGAQTHCLSPSPQCLATERGPVEGRPRRSLNPTSALFLINLFFLNTRVCFGLFFSFCILGPFTWQLGLNKKHPRRECVWVRRQGVDWAPLPPRHTGCWDAFLPALPFSRHRLGLLEPQPGAELTRSPSISSPSPSCGLPNPVTAPSAS